MAFRPFFASEFQEANLKRILALMMIPLLGMFAVPARADEPPPPWKGSVGLAYVETSGNSSSKTFSGELKIERNFSPSKLTLQGSALYSESNDVTSDENWYGSLKYDRHLTERSYLYLLQKTERNTFQGIEFRYTYQGGFGYYLLNSPKDVLKAELGAGYIHEDQINPFPDRGFPSARVFGGYTHNFTEKSRFDEWVEYLPSLKKKKDYLINEETALITNLVGSLALKVSFTVAYDNLPPPGHEKSDRTFKTALLYTF